MACGTWIAIGAHRPGEGAPVNLGDVRMRRHRVLVFAAATLSAALWTYACGDGATEPRPPSRNGRRR